MIPPSSPNTVRSKHTGRLHRYRSTSSEYRVRSSTVRKESFLCAVRSVDKTDCSQPSISETGRGCGKFSLLFLCWPSPPANWCFDFCFESLRQHIKNYGLRGASCFLRFGVDCGSQVVGDSQIDLVCHDAINDTNNTNECKCN